MSLIIVVCYSVFHVKTLQNIITEIKVFILQGTFACLHMEKPMIKIHPSDLQLFQLCLVRDQRILTLLITALLIHAAGLKTAPE